MLELVRCQKDWKITKKQKRRIFQCCRNGYMEEKTQKTKWEIHRSIKGKYKHPGIRKNIF